MAYESPEQANHKPYDGRNDIWALGCLVTEMLTGTMVFRRVEPGAVFALQEDVLASTIAECASVSADWGRLVAWLLTIDVTLRPTAEFVVATMQPIVEALCVRVGVICLTAMRFTAHLCCCLPPRLAKTGKEGQG